MSDLLSENGDGADGISSSHDIRREIERMGEEISSKYCREFTRPVLLPPIPPLPPPSPSSDSNGSGSSTSVARHKAVVQVYQTLQDLPVENLVVLQGLQYTHLQYSLFVNHSCSKKDHEVEGYCDYLVLGHGFISLFDVRATPWTDHDEIFAEEHKLAVSQRTATLKLVRRCCIKTFRFKMPDILQFSVFVSVTKEAAQQLPSYAALSDKEKECLIFRDELEMFAEWWHRRMPLSGRNHDKEFDTALQRVKQTLIGIWAINGKNMIEASKCDLAHNVKVLSDQLDGQATQELRNLASSIREQAIKSGAENGFSEIANSSNCNYHGPKPELHIIAHRVSEDRITATLRGVLDSELEKVSVIENTCKAVITSNTDLCKNACDGLPCSILNFGADLNEPGKYSAVVCVVDLLDILRLSTLRDESYAEFQQVFCDIHSAVSSAVSHCCVILCLGATEVYGDPSFDKFGSETFNKKTRNYFNATRNQIVNLVRALATSSRCSWLDANVPSTLTQVNPDKMLSWADALYAFPDKQLNRDLVRELTEHTRSVGESVARLSDVVCAQEQATQMWSTFSSCSNEALLVMESQLDTMIGDIGKLVEVQAVLTSQLQNLGNLYEQMRKEVVDNID